MKKVIIFTLSMIATFNVAAIGGVGDVVSDPTSYTYYAKQLEEVQKQLQTAKENLSTAIEAKDIAMKTKSNLEGTYRRAQRAISNFQSMREQLDKDPMRFAEKMIEDRRDVAGMMDSTAKKVSSVFNPAKNSMEDIQEFTGQDADGNDWSSDWIAVKQAKKQVARKELEKAIVDAEKADAMVGLQLEDIEDLAKKANAAPTQKDASDITNALLLQMIEQNQQLIELVSNISRSYAMTSLSEGNWNNKDIYQKAKERKEKRKDHSNQEGYFGVGGLVDMMKEKGYE